MSGETNLDALLQGMSADLADGVYVFATVAKGWVPQNVMPRMMFEEAEGMTLIMLRADAEAHGIAYEFPCRMITLKIHSALDAVGFLARITTTLAAEGMGVNPVSGFYHDHLFVPEGREEDAIAALKALSEA
ncbi:MAG: ACT domain-containing protein [Pseudomonadota bacterium]